MKTSRFLQGERRFLLLIIGGFLVAYVGAFLSVVLHKEKGRPTTGSRPLVRWMPPAVSAHSAGVHYLFSDLMDPSLLSLPNPHGFSASLWSRTSPATFPLLTPAIPLAYLNAVEWNDPQPLLQQKPLAEALRFTLNKPAAPPELGADTNAMSTSVVNTQSTFRVEGNLSKRMLLRAPSLPMIMSETRLRPTQVRIAIATDGTVAYAMLQRSCGNELADDQAVSLARDIYFEPRNNPTTRDLTWGWLRFHWAVTAPTNNVVPPTS